MSGQADGMADDGKRAVRKDTSNKSLTCHEPLESIFFSPGTYGKRARISLSASVNILSCSVENWLVHSVSMLLTFFSRTRIKKLCNS